MKCLNIQIQSELCIGIAENHVRELTETATSSVTDAIVNIERGNDGGPYININIESDDIASLWSSISSQIISNPSLRSSAIVCCEGDDGWNDYFLLHHFNKNETLDKFS